MDNGDLKDSIRQNAAEISRLHARIRETLGARGKGARELADWQRACAEFHARYDALACPGGYAGAAARILVGDPSTIEAALCFLELRPYFFRSGYMFQKLLRKLKRAVLTPPQAARLKLVLARQAAWAATRQP